MRILEVRDDFIKFEAESNTQLSSFIQIDGIEKKYIAQVLQLKRSGEKPIGYAKILFLYNGELQSYDKTLPSKESIINEFDINILLNSINYDQPIIAGKAIGTDSKVIVDESVFNKKTLICTDDKNANNLLTRNLSKQFNNLNKRVIIIDTLGILSAKKVIAGVDFKLPLDTNSLAFMYKDCLNDATGDSKSLIIEIFKDLAEYSKTVEFLPFSALKNIIDDMVDKSHVFKLLVLKNKLAKFDRLGYFAKDKTELDNVDKILSSQNVIIDFSKLDVAFQNRYLDFIYEKLAKNENIQVIFELSNTVNKKCLKNVLLSNVSTAFITHSKFKYLNDIKNLFDNFILTPSIAINQIFTVFNSFLKSMSNDSFLIAGEGTNYIPIVSPLEKIDDFIVPQKTDLIEYSSSNEENENTETEDIQEIDEEKVDTDDALEEIAIDDSDISTTENNEQSEEFDEITEIEYQQEELEQPSLTEEEIISTIDEKSQDIISKVTENIEIPEKINMFDDEESISEDSISNLEDDNEFDEQNVIIEENNNQISPEIEHELLNSLNENNNSTDFEEDIQEIPLTENFSTEIHSEEIIEDYVSDDENNIPEEITINEELDSNEINETSLEELDSNSIDELNPESEEENSAIILDNDIDLDIDDTNEDMMLSPEDDSQEQSPLEQLPIDDEISVMPLSEDNIGELDDFVELNPDDIDENDIIVDMTDDELPLPDNIDEQIVKDVDKVFTTRKDDEISDSDLDFIDEMNNDESEILEEIPAEDNLLEEIAESEEENSGILENIEPAPLEEENDNDLDILETRSSSTPIVPVYDADIPQEDLVESDPIQQGDSVTHAKYGSGVVEKMIKYGNKTLYSINFDNIGRRLLDPTLTEIKKS